jgi:hypothetical protein
MTESKSQSHLAGILNRVRNAAYLIRVKATLLSLMQQLITVQSGGFMAVRKRDMLHRRESLVYIAYKRIMNTRPHTNFLSLLVCLAMFSTDTFSTQLKLNDSHFTENSQAEIKFDPSRHITGPRLSFSHYRKGCNFLTDCLCSYNQEVYGNIKENTADFCKLFGIDWL